MSDGSPPILFSEYLYLAIFPMGFFMVMAKSCAITTIKWLDLLLPNGESITFI